ncbi:MAG: tetratricopeptide repeat protein [Bacteroidales bacterium]|nr:tetratricopeptide repeat protein [Bacteroidales bacterium]
MKEFWTKNKNNIWFWAFIIIAAALFFIMPLLSLDAGNSGDEDGFQWPYAKQIYDYYATGGKDTTCLKNDDMGMHGGFFDQLTYATAKWFHVENYSQLRHVMNSGFGWICILFAGLIALKVAGWRAAVFTLLLMFFSPRLLGHSFNNPKDLIFASMLTASLYYVVCLIKEYPKPRISTSIKLAVFAALAIVSRFAGYLIFAYLVLFLIIYHIMMKKKTDPAKERFKTVGRYVIFVAAIGLVTFGLTIALWPYIMSSPIQTTMKIFHGMSQYDIAIRQLFEGTLQWSDRLPWYYTPKYILISIPIAVIIGMILFFIFCWRKKEERFWAFFIFFTFFFPVFWIVYTHANVYGGWRHAMFAYPPMVVAAGWGFDALVKWVESKFGINKEQLTINNEGETAQPTSTKGIIVNVASVVVILALLIGPIRHIVANHPYEYVYFNELAGGMNKAFGNYEMDYYYHSTREATEWVIANAEPKADGSKVRVGTWHQASVSYFLRNDTARFQSTFIRWYEKENSDWDYAVFTITGINPEYLRSSHFPPKNTVKTIEVDGKPICIVLKREDKSDCQAFKYKNEGRLDSAFILYQQALQKDPENLGALLNLGELYVRTNRPDSALHFLNRYTEIDPYAEVANYMTAYAYIYKGDNDKALDIVRKIQKHNIKYTGAYYLAIQIYMQKRDFVAANKEFMKLIDIDRVDDQFVQVWLQFNQMQNIDAQHAYIKLYKAMAKSFEKRGKKKEAEQYRKLATGR